jgi:serine/threonine-protein kinase
MEIAGMVTIVMDARGNLQRLLAVPPQIERPGASTEAPDWKPLFTAAGLDLGRFSPTAPKWAPAAPFDARADWEAEGLHVAAAAWQGRPVWFEVIYPWSAPEREVESSEPPWLGDLPIIIYIGGGWTAAILLARRNLRLGRGDRRGALRVASFVFVVGIVAWLFRWHHVPQPATEFFQLILGVQTSLFFAVYVWLAYVGIEPIVRRRSPELLFSWTRILTGRFRDPLVGRDLLVGLCGGTAMALLGQIPLILALWVPVSPMTPQPPADWMLISSASTISGVFNLLSRGPLDGLGFTTIFVFGLVLFRRRWLAAAMVGLIAMLLVAGGSGENFV